MPFEIYESSITSRPVIGIYWCCPIGGYRGDEMVSVYMVVEDRVVGLLPEESNQFWPVTVSGESFTRDDCVEGVDSDPDRDGYDDFFCYQSRFTTYTINGARAIESEVKLIDIPGQPFDTCIWSIGEECGYRTVVEDMESCVFSALMEVYRFPIDSCQYGYWVLEFEEALFDDGFPVNPDGFYLPSEMAVVSRAQLLAGLESDGLIGPATWARFVEYAQCSETFGVGGMPNDIVSCEYDMNGDGLFGPGDIVPD